jgi:hypothetical protein
MKFDSGARKKLNQSAERRWMPPSEHLQIFSLSIFLIFDIPRAFRAHQDSVSLFVKGLMQKH